MSDPEESGFAVFISIDTLLRKTGGADAPPEVIQ
jgi:hypothetical protein